MPERLSLKKNIIWNSSGSFIYLFFQWLVTYLVVILLGFDNAGIFSLAVAIASIAFASSLYGVRGFQVSDIRKKYTDKTYLVTRIVTSSISIIAVILYLTLSHYSLYISLCIIFYLMFKVTEAYVDVYHGIIQKSMRMDYIGKSFILRGIVSNTLFIITAITFRDLLFAIIVMALSSFALIYIYDRKKVRFFYTKGEASLKSTIQLLIECLPLAIYTLLSNLLMSLPRIDLETIKGTEILGIYASIAIPAAIIQVFAGYIFSPVLTIFAEHVDNRNFKSFRELFIKTSGYIIIFSLIAIIVGILIGDYGLRLLFGEYIAPYTYLFLPILIISSLTALSWFIGLMLTILRDFKGLIIASVLAVFICIFSSSYFIKTFDINGINFILIIALTIQIFIMLTSMVFKIRKLKLYSL